MINEEFFSNVEKWSIESKKGLLCGIFGCNESVEIRCSICRRGYCFEHKKYHFHNLKKK